MGYIQQQIGNLVYQRAGSKCCEVKTLDHSLDQWTHAANAIHKCILCTRNGMSAVSRNPDHDDLWALWRRGTQWVDALLQSAIIQCLRDKREPPYHPHFSFLEVCLPRNGSHMDAVNQATPMQTAFVHLWVLCTRNGMSAV